MNPRRTAHGGDLGLRFPQVDGRTLLGADVMLPADLPADRTLAVVAFQRGHQSQVDRWIARAVAAGVPATSRGQEGPIPVGVVEIPSLSSRWRPARRFIDGGMTSAIGDPDVLARTITIYTDVDAFRRSLAIPTREDVWAFVVTREGSILASATGEPDDAAWDLVAGALLGD
jgi:hypothetical protein